MTLLDLLLVRSREVACTVGKDTYPPSIRWSEDDSQHHVYNAISRGGTEEPVAPMRQDQCQSNVFIVARSLRETLRGMRRSWAIFPTPASEKHRRLATWSAEVYCSLQFICGITG